MEQSVIITLDNNINALDERTAGDRYGEDLLPVEGISEVDDTNDLYVTESCVIQNAEHQNYGNKRFAKTLHEYIKTEDKVEAEKNKEEDENKKEQKEEIWPIMRDDNPMCEFTNNDEIIGGCFPYLFLRGNEMLLKSTLLFGLINALL